MGMNFYLITRNKEIAEKFAPYSFELTDTPYWGYKIHIAKTSAGWLPLFQYHSNGISSVKDIKDAYNTDKVEIYDESEQKYLWAEFEERVLKFNGGVAGIAKPVRYDKSSKYSDMDMPDYLPVSHFDYARGKYSKDYFKDDKGYEFSISIFE